MGFPATPDCCLRLAKMGFKQRVALQALGHFGHGVGPAPASVAHLVLLLAGVVEFVPALDPAPLQDSMFSAKPGTTARIRPIEILKCFNF
jgi:hypothetical protein